MSEHRTTSRQGAGRAVRSLAELPQEKPPGRDLWPQIEARLTEAPPIEAPPTEAPPMGGQRARPRQMRRPAWEGWRVRLAAAVGLLALGAALMSGVWLTHGKADYDRVPTGSEVVSGISPQMPALDARSRAAMLRSLDARLRSLPPPSRQKVLADLQVIEQSMQDIQSALGRDPGNALLREMLSETYQDEQHLFATVQEAGVWTREAGGGKGST